MIGVLLFVALAVTGIALTIALPPPSGQVIMLMAVLVFIITSATLRGSGSRTE